MQYGGIWLYPPDIKSPEGKARLLYEVRAIGALSFQPYKHGMQHLDGSFMPRSPQVAPMSFLAEQAGGMSCRGPMADQRVLEVVPQAVHQASWKTLRDMQHEPAGGIK